VTAYDALLASGLLAIVRYRAGGDVARVVRTIAEGGISAIEVTTNTPRWREVISGCADLPAVAIGAGTVTSFEHVWQAADAGATYVVTPGFDASVTAAAQRAGLEVVAGIATATEVQAARAAGVRLLKLFPAGALGLDYLRQLRGPFSDATFVATGGIRIEDVAAWRSAGADVVSLGSDLTGSSVPADDEEWAALRSRAAAAIASLG
jgi:2-dehydro-3-deoxyphosphogluconate aldolase/(4S)-4-hydroxy-2-oxoglutarate aldolase